MAMSALGSPEKAMLTEADDGLEVFESTRKLCKVLAYFGYGDITVSAGPNLSLRDARKSLDKFLSRRLDRSSRWVGGINAPKRAQPLGCLVIDLSQPDQYTRSSRPLVSQISPRKSCILPF